MTCKRDAEGYRLPEHQRDCVARDCPGCVECTHDDRGNPVRHCGIRWQCTSHLSDGQHACPRCLGMIRRNLIGIITALAAMPPEVEQAGLQSGALTYAGPSAHPDGFRVRMLHNDTHGRDTEDYDQLDPWAMLGVRERMIREDLGHDHRILTSPTLVETCNYLNWVLTDLTRDEQQTIIVADLLAETSRLKSHLEAVLRDSHAPERGAPCPLCTTPAPRLVKKWAHWCDDANCKREHDQPGEEVEFLSDHDSWQCPRNEDHWWSDGDYREWVDAGYLANAERLTADQIEAQHDVKAGTVRVWATRGLVRKRGVDQRGRALYDVSDTLARRDRNPSSCA